MTGSLIQAEKRVREMNRVQRQYLEQSNRQFGRPAQTSVVSTPRFEPVQTHHPEPKPPDAPVKPAESLPPKNIPQNHTPPSDSFLNMDSEKVLILILIFVLLKEKADMKLILALAYLLT